MLHFFTKNTDKLLKIEDKSNISDKILDAWSTKFYAPSLEDAYKSLQKNLIVKNYRRPFQL